MLYIPALRSDQRRWCVETATPLPTQFSRARWVDDFYGPDCDENAEHTRRMFVRLVRCILGDDAIADNKTASGNPLSILGVVVEAQCSGIRLKPDRGKCLRWKLAIREALHRGTS